MQYNIFMLNDLVYLFKSEFCGVAKISDKIHANIILSTNKVNTVVLVKFKDLF